MKKYLIFADGKSPHTFKWINELKKYFIVYIVSFNGFNDDIKNNIENTYLINLATVVSIKGGNAGVLKHIFKAVNIINKINPEYINAHYITSYGTVAAIAASLSQYKGKLILSAWGSDVLVTPNKNLCYYNLTKWLLKKADLVTSDSYFMSDEIKKIFSETRIMTFPFGIDKLPEINGDDKNELYFFSNRALEPNYNIMLVLKIFNDLFQKNSKRQLIIAHNGSEKAKIEKMVSEFNLRDNVQFVGFLTLEEQQSWYKKCKYYFSLPISDSTSVSLLEAMSFGCIPIVSDIPANKEWVEDHVNGIVYSLDVPVSEFNLEIKNAFSINRKIISERAIWNKSILRYIELLNKL